MIRINLLPEAKRQVGGGGSLQVWAIAYLVSTVAWCVLLAIVYWRFSNELSEQRAANQSLQQEITQADKQNADLASVQEKLAKSKKLEEVVTRLQKARSGPTRLLMELSRVLSQGKGPTIDQKRLEELRRENPLIGFSSTWDIRRLWIKSFEENNRKCNIKGVGKTNEDVAEFLRRLALSELFKVASLDETNSGIDSASGTPVVTFSISCEVKY